MIFNSLSDYFGIARKIDWNIFSLYYDKDVTDFMF